MISMRRMAVGPWLALVLSACTLSPLAYPAATLPPMPTDTSTATFTVAPTDTATPTPTATPTDTPTPTEMPTATSTPTSTPMSFVYVYPVQPPEVSGFSPGGHGYPATDIFAPIGAHFVAVTSGVVDFVSYKDRWEPKADDPALRGGLCIAIIGDDGIRYYGAHLSAVVGGIAPGVRVAAGQWLGNVGNTGNAAATPPHLHFGISHPTFPEDWQVRRGELDPVPYLLAWKRGENLRPQFPTPTPTSEGQVPTP